MCAVVHAVTKLDTYEQLNNKPKVKTNEFLLRCLKKKKPWHICIVYVMIFSFANFWQKNYAQNFEIFHGVHVPLINCGPFAKSCSTLFEPTDCSALGFPVLLHLPEFAQTPVCWVDDAIQSSHPLLSPSPLALKINDRSLGSLVEYMTGVLLWFNC